MKRVLYGMLCLLLVAGCSKDKIEEDTPVLPDDVTLELSATDLVFESGGGKQEFTITSNAEWTITNESEWCTTDVTSGKGDKTVTVTVATSAETEDRNLNLSVRAGEQTSVLTVTEKHGNALILAKDKFDLPQDGGDVSIDVKSDVEEVIIPAEYQSWITLAPDTRAAQIKCYVFIILEQKGKDGRWGYIIFKSGERSDTVFIFQAPEERLILSEDTCRVSGKGGDLTVELKSNIVYDVTIPAAAASWVNQVTERSFRSDRLKLHIEADTTVDRNTEIVIKNRYGDETDTLYIRQTSTQSPKEDITSAFDPAFAGLLQRLGYIPDSTRILRENIQHIDSLVVYWKALTSLKGIEYFESLRKLYCGSNRLTSLDVSNNTALTHLNCSSNQLTSLDVSKNTALTQLYCSSNQLTSLNISNCTALAILYCQTNQLTSLDVSKNTALEQLYCQENQLKSLDISNNMVLTNLYCGNNQLTLLDVSKNTALVQLGCNGNQLTSLDVNKNTALGSLFCYSNQLTSLDISRDTALTILYCYNNPGDGKAIFPVTAWFYDNDIPSGFGYVKNWSYGDNIITIRFQTEEDIKDITADFDPEFAKVLQENGYIPDAAHITLGDVKGIKALYIYATEADYQAGKGLTSLKGIEYFESLTNLYCENNQLTSLDLSQNTALTDVSCYDNQLTSLNVTKNTALTSLACGGNRLTALDVSKNTALTYLSCGSNQLTSLDVSRNTALVELRCLENQLTSLNVGINTVLTKLWCHFNKLASLDVSGCTALDYLRCNDNPGDEKNIFSLTVWNDYKNTIRIAIDDYNGTVMNRGEAWEYEGKKVWFRLLNEKYSKDITADFDPGFAKALQEKGYIPDASHIIRGETKLLTLSYLDFSRTEADYQAGKGLTSLAGIEYFESLTYLSCAYNQLTSLDVTKNTGLGRLSCDYNQLTSLDVSKNTVLTNLSCGYNQLTSLDIGKNTALVNLYCPFNQITSLDVSGCTALTSLYCVYNQFTSLNLSGCTTLTELGCGGNQLSFLDISGCTALTELNFNSFQFTSLNASGCTALTKLDCSNNQLTFLDVSNCTALTTLTCYWNRLTSLDVSGCTALTTLGCSHNQLISLDVSDCTVLTTLRCSSNQLTSLDVTKNVALITLECSGNPGDGESFFPVTAWFDNNTVPGNMKFTYEEDSSFDGKSWTYDGKTITIDFRKAE